MAGVVVEAGWAVSWASTGSGERQSPPASNIFVKRKPAFISSRFVFESPSYPAASAKCLPRDPYSSTGSMNRTGLKGLGAIPSLSGVDQHEFAIVLGRDFDLALACDGDTVAGIGLDAVHAHPATGNKIEVTSRIGVD